MIGLSKNKTVSRLRLFLFHFRIIFFLAGIGLVPVFLSSCGGNNPASKSTKRQAASQKKVIRVNVPEFNADSAYYYTKVQTELGPRVPQTEAHEKCAAWLTNTLKRFTPYVTVQDFKARIYDNRIFDGENIIASFNPDYQKRIFLSSHWDSRPFADHDPDPANHHTPIDGANDGAATVGILLEIARQLSMQQPPIGVDIVLFDLEDYGPPQDSQTSASSDTWGLGSQYWAKNPHKIGYSANYGILLDMTGAADAIFPKEGYSVYYAPDVVEKVWNTARSLGYGDYFVNETGGYITDDHYFVNKLADIPTIDIIHLDNTSPNGSFYKYWHTVNDKLEFIDPATLKVVGKTLLTVIYNEK